MYGTQTRIIFIDHDHMFENDVEMYGTQTKAAEIGCIDDV